MNDILTHLVVAHEHPSLPGHFPGRPIVPGVVLLDLILDAIRAATQADMRIESIVSTKFLQAVSPGQRVDLKITFSPDNVSHRVKARFVASRDAAAVLEGSFMLTTSSAGEAA